MARIEKLYNRLLCAQVKLLDAGKSELAEAIYHGWAWIMYHKNAD